MLFDAMQRQEIMCCDWGSEQGAEGVHATRLRNSDKRGVRGKESFLCGPKQIREV